MANPIIIEELRKLAETFVAQEPARLEADGWWQTPLLGPTQRKPANPRVSR